MSKLDTEQGAVGSEFHADDAATVSAVQQYRNAPTVDRHVVDTMTTMGVTDPGPHPPTSARHGS